MSRPFLDLRQALRAVPRAPVFFGAAMLSLALGIGGVTAFFGLAHHYLFRPLPYTHPERLVALGERRITQGRANDLSMGPSSFQAWREDARSFEHLALFRPLGREVDTGTGPTFGPVASVSEGFFETLGLRPALGRFFLRAEETPGQPRLAVLSHRCWQERYASDPSALGRTVSIAGEPFVIVGVAPDFTFPNTWIQRAPLVFPLMQLRDRSSYRAIHMFEGLGCLRPGIGREQALAELETIQARQAAAFPDTNRGVGARLVDLRSRLFGNRSRSLGLLTGAAGLLLLIAALNGAGLFLARGLAKTRETALRAALGARTAQLFTPFLAEGVLVALGGAAGGMVLAGLLLGILPRILSDAAPLPGGTAPTLNLWLVGLALLVSLLSSLAVSALPVLRTRNTDLASTLGEGARGASGGKGHLRGTLLAGEVALAIVLLMGTGLLLRSMGRLMGRDLGYQPKDLVTFIVDVNTPGLRQPAPMEAFRRTLLERVRSLPGIEMAAVASHSPVESIGEFSKIHLGTESPRSEDPEVPILCVSDGYFETLGVRTIQGRRLSDLDGPSAPAVVMVNQAFANRFFPGGEAVGQVLRASYLDGPLRIVGVVADMRTGGPEGEVQPLLIHPVGQLLNGEFCVTLRTRRALQDLSPALEEAVRAANASRKPLGLARVTEEVRSSLDERRNTVILLGAFAALALTLATVGIYGVTAYTVTQRRREIGIRLALGGHPSTVVGNVLRRELAFIGSGTCLGLVASLGLGRILQTQLVEVGPTDPGVLLGAVSTLALAGALACLMPALRVTSADPSSVLHEE